MSSHGDSAEPDLTPMLDMVFQLITFFMLVLNVKAAYIDTTLSLPIVGSAKPVDDKGLEELMVINVNKEGHVKAYGKDVGSEPAQIEKFIASEAEASLTVARRKNPEIKHGDRLPSQIVIRADKSTPYRLLNIVITTCQKHGYQNFALKSKSKDGK